MDAFSIDADTRGPIEQFLRELVAALTGKQPRVPAGAQKRSVFLFIHAAGAPTRIEVVLSPSRVTVSDVPAVVPDVVFRARAEDWLRHQKDAGCAERFDIYGDVSVLQEIARLVSTSRSPIAARFFC